MFVRGSPTLTFSLVFEWEGGSKYHYKRATIGPPAKRHLNDVACCLRADGSQTINTGLIAL